MDSELEHHELPIFLRPSRRVGIRGPEFSCRNAIFPHQPPLDPVDALWWPSTRKQVDIVVLFIPGNPGLLDFYASFLSRFHAKDGWSGKLAILAHAHIGHTPGFGSFIRCPHSENLTIQVASAIEAFDALANAFPSAKVVIMAHSVGAWISLQITKFRKNFAGILLLFPTICHIAHTPNGQLLFWLFRCPMRDIISLLSRAAILLPTAFLTWVFPSWPAAQLLVLQRFIRCPPAVNAALCMANDEMHTIRELEVGLIQECGHRLWMFFAEEDGWVGQQREHILEVISSNEANVTIVHGEPGIPHAFCINHAEPLAQQCFQWLHSNPACI